METAIVDILKPILEQWPVVALLGVVGVYMYKEYRGCVSDMREHIKWLQELLVSEMHGKDKS